MRTGTALCSVIAAAGENLPVSVFSPRSFLLFFSPATPGEWNRHLLEDHLGRVKAEHESRLQKGEQRAVKAGGNFLDHLHPKIFALAKPRFESGHLADAVETCLRRSTGW